MWIAAAGVEVWLSVDIKGQKQEGKLVHITKHQYNRRPAAAVSDTSEVISYSTAFISQTYFVAGLLLHQYRLLWR